MSRLRPAPAARYIHPKAAGLLEEEGDHDADLDVASESAPNYLSWVADLCRERLGHRVLEVGAGLGAITARYEQGRDVVANDVSPECVSALHERFANHPNVRVEDRDLRTLAMDASFDSVLMVNVLEHIADDAGALEGLSRLLVPGGNVVVYVPALNGLYGALDRRIGHYRRYSVWRLGEVFREAGLEPVELRWVNFVAIPAWAAFGRGNVDDRQRSGTLLSLWDRTAVPAGRVLEAHVRVPIGLNVLGVGRRHA
ncbi:MAG: class I SAM-dependent methyltransferase [Solirubrobacteraceae bacterium]